MKKSILIVEDEVQIAKVLKLELEYEGFETALAYDGDSGLEMMLQSNFDLILLDLMLPKLSGSEVLRRYRKVNNHTPVILLTARNATMDKVFGLDLGADDYITKPYETEELLARVRAAVRHNELLEKRNASSEHDPIITVGEITVDTVSREVTKAGTTFQLTQKEYELLVYLIDHKNRVVTRDNILTNVWGYEYEGDTNVIDVYIRHLRKKLDDPTFILSIRGVGYTLKEK
ncbi:response regulator transcription factor [Sinanaerobacter chloroacetimidivorans]|uniref:Stage 0 sporulation protein A homolog n=1 Tax=Sinanaerobacter chloroacetimidivorans TaxID=2818044 RepID=A0A8J8B267_9FIRM|nr:response regulator transcription factor [Sinanaerobacter chloroacetimidivorans]MBR0598451.1 response regulator transcription factor [Sinanaerobacter chloroacetimidivorans]